MFEIQIDKKLFTMWREGGGSSLKIKQNDKEIIKRDTKSKNKQKEKMNQRNELQEIIITVIHQHLLKIRWVEVMCQLIHSKIFRKLNFKNKRIRTAVVLVSAAARISNKKVEILNC